ncbi:MAG: hypothetical protein WAQ53_11765 [Thiofilum sp.]|uniref:hypothetical protein n=1 Tax=Thiofilum sp. TaxID=2212733 RepID=UPI0025D535B4|nr:hypothetical protein [Thiofilum sp.]MBK8452568.1 hypothetical protein [Thiofilum sp.]
MKNLGQLVLGGLFLFIGNAQGNQLFQNPMINGYPLDLCKEWASNCGKPATDAFCKLKGFPEAITYSVKHDSPTTRIINGGQLCDMPQCDRITAVVCKQESVVFSYPIRYGANNTVLDWCSPWAQNCGLPTADRFCKEKGFTRASSHGGMRNLSAGEKSRIFGEGQVCDDAGCGSFRRITCVR